MTAVYRSGRRTSPAGNVDRAAALSLQNGYTLCTFGDMMRVPGERGNLLDAKALGGDVRMMVSPMDVLRWASDEPSRIFAVAAVGFETTLPIYALLMERLSENGIGNVRLLTSLKAILPALQWICTSEPDIDGSGPWACEHHSWQQRLWRALRPLPQADGGERV